MRSSYLYNGNFHDIKTIFYIEPALVVLWVSLGTQVFVDKIRQMIWFDVRFIDKNFQCPFINELLTSYFGACYCKPFLDLRLMFVQKMCGVYMNKLLLNYV